MKATSSNLIKAITLSVALMGSTAIVATLAMPDVVYAKEGKGGGKGGGNGGGKGGGNGGGNDGGKGGGKGASYGADKGDKKKAKGKSGKTRTKSDGSRSKSSKKGKFSLKDLFKGKKAKERTAKVEKKKLRVTRKTVEVTPVVKPQPRPKGNRIAGLLGVHPSELGALNAANASETALLNAAPNSRVGRIAIYRDTVLAGGVLKTELEEKQALLDSMDPPARTVEEIDAELDLALEQVNQDAERVAQLEQDLIDAGGEDADIQAELDQANEDLASSQAAVDDLSSERQTTQDYEDTVAAVDDLTTQVENQTLTEREALEAAANKPVTDEVEAAVRAILGL